MPIADGAIILEARRVIEIVGQALDLAAEAELNRLIHRTVVDDGDIDLLVAFLRLELGQRVRRVAGDIFHLDAVGLLEGRHDLVADRLLERAAITGDIERFLLRRACDGSEANAARLAAVKRREASSGSTPIH
jgi:hypothetical protein